MRTILFATPDDLSREEIDAFWHQGICMDDWDYMLLLDDPDRLLEPDDEEEPDEEGRPRYRCVDWNVERLLSPTYQSTWYSGTYQGKRYAIGVVYHA